MSVEELNLNKKVHEEAQIIWDYMQLGHSLKPTDIIFVLGSRDDRIALHAAELYHQKYAPRIVVSGGISHKNDLLATKWGDKTEADHFSNIMIENNVPKEGIILETKASNTGDNVKNTYSLLKSLNLLPKSVILVQKPYMQRRTYATFMKQWPNAQDLEVMISSPGLNFNDYINEDQPMDEVISIMVGDLQRIIEYPKMNYQIYQKVPEHVQKAYRYLVQQGFNKHLLQQK